MKFKHYENYYKENHLQQQKFNMKFKHGRSVPIDPNLQQQKFNMKFKQQAKAATA